MILIPNHITPLALSLPQSRPMTCAIPSNPPHPLEGLHIVAPFPAALSSPPFLLRLELITRITVPWCEEDPYPTPHLRQISVMTVSGHKNPIQTTDSLDSTQSPLLGRAPLLSPTLKDPPIKDFLIKTENPEMIPRKGALNGTTDDTIALAGELMTDPASLTTDVTRLISAMETTTASMIARVLRASPLLSTDRVTTVLLGIMMSDRQLFVLRITNNHPLRVVMTDGCHHRPPLLLCLTLVVPLLHRLRLVLKGPAGHLSLTLHPCFPLTLLKFGVLMIVPRDNLP